MITKKIAATAVLAAGAAAAATLGAIAPANAQYNKFVAISYSPEAGVYGRGGGGTLDQARVQSLNDCQNSGGSHCLFVVWAEDGCAAIALKDWQLPGREQYFGAFGRTRQDAYRVAIQGLGGGFGSYDTCSAG